jgi:hypothetical protein
MSTLKKMWNEIDRVKRYELVLASIRTIIAVAMLTFVVVSWLKGGA